jgi:hypothetical protein
MFDTQSLALLAPALDTLAARHAELPPVATPAQPAADDAAMAAVLQQVAVRMQDNYPYGHPLYAGQMLKPPHPVARLAYALAMFVNPNNHALDGGRASSAMETRGGGRDRAHVRLGRASGAPHRRRHHGQRRGAVGCPRTAPGPQDSGFGSRPISRTAGSPRCWAWPSRASLATAHARMDLAALQIRAARTGDVGTVVVTLGPPPPARSIRCREILALRERYGFRLHVDAAYGGYHTLCGNLEPEARAAFDADRPGRLDRDRPAQARPAALRLRLHAVPRSVGRPLLQARLALHLLQLQRAAPGRDQPRVLARRRGGGGALGHDAAVSAERGGAFAQGLEASREAALALHETAARRCALPDRTGAPAGHRRFGRRVARRPARCRRVRRRSSRPPRAKTCTWPWRASPRRCFPTGRWPGTATTCCACARA